MKKYIKNQNTEKSLALCILVLKIVQVEVLIFRICSKAGAGGSGTWDELKLEAPARCIKEPLVCTSYCRWSLYQGNFPSGARDGRFQGDADETSPSFEQALIQTLLRVWHWSMWWAWFNRNAHPFSKAFYLGHVLLSCHGFLLGFVSEDRWQGLCVCVHSCAAVGNLPVCH